MKIAIASSGLGHISRGIETWAKDTAIALHEHGIDVTLFKAEGRGRRTENGGRRTERNRPLNVVSLRCWKRTDSKTRLCAAVLPSFLWRWGFRSVYGIEQFTFWRKLRKELIAGDFDILHVQDPMLAYWCNRARKKGQVRTKEILAHGTEEGSAFLQRFEYVQHLAPWHLEQLLEYGRKKAQKAQKEEASGNSNHGLHGSYGWGDGDSGDVFGISNADASRNSGHGCHDEDGKDIREHPRYQWFKNFSHCWSAIPNFVDTDVFRPVADKAERIGIRRELGIPEDAFVIGCAAAVKKEHKRVDYLIREFATFTALSTNLPNQPSAINHQPYLLIAGSRQKDTDEMVAMARDLAADRIKILTDVPREEMPGLYRCMDVFVLTSLFEMMPIAVLEALASGLPVIANDHPVLAWMTGVSEEGNAGGETIEMSQDGALAKFLSGLTPEWVAEHGAAARLRAKNVFATDVVIGEYMNYYEQVMEDQE